MSGDKSAAVNEAIDRFRFRFSVNHTARNLATRRTGSVAFVISEAQERLFEDPNFGVLITTCSMEVMRLAVHLVVMAAAPLVSNVHVKDFGYARRKGGSGFEVTGRRLGEGQLDYRYMLDAVGSRHTNVSFVLEHWLPWQGSEALTCRTEADWTSHGVRLLLGHQTAANTAGTTSV